MGREIGDNLYASCAGEGYYPDSGNTADQNTPETTPGGEDLLTISLSPPASTTTFYARSPAGAVSVAWRQIQGNDWRSITITKLDSFADSYAFSVTKES